MECSSAQTNSRNDTAYPVSGYAWLNMVKKNRYPDAGDHWGAWVSFDVSPYDMSFNTVDATVERPFLYSSHDHHWLRGYNPPYYYWSAGPASAAAGPSRAPTQRGGSEGRAYGRT
jgi:hypothetical protein